MGWCYAFGIFFNPINTQLGLEASKIPPISYDLERPSAFPFFTSNTRYIFFHFSI